MAYRSVLKNGSQTVGKMNPDAYNLFYLICFITVSYFLRHWSDI